MFLINHQNSNGCFGFCWLSVAVKKAFFLLWNSIIYHITTTHWETRVNEPGQIDYQALLDRIRINI